MERFYWLLTTIGAALTWEKEVPATVTIDAWTSFDHGPAFSIADGGFVTYLCRFGTDRHVPVRNELTWVLR